MDARNKPCELQDNRGHVAERISAFLDRVAHDRVIEVAAASNAAVAVRAVVPGVAKLRTEQTAAMDDNPPDPAPTAGEVRARVRATFEDAAATYDAVDVDFFRPVATGLVAALGAQPGERALDVGCGRSAALFALIEAVGPGGHVTAIDLSPTMVEMTTADVADAGATDRATVRVGDAQDPDVPAEPVDLVASSLVLFFLPDPASALAAWRAPLVDGGRLGVSTFGPYNEEWAEVDRIFSPYLPPHMADPRTRAGGPFASDAAMEELLANAGYHDVRTVTWTMPVRFNDVAQWERWTWSTGQRRMWEAVPIEDRPAVRALAAERLDACRDAQGHISFDQGVRYNPRDTLSSRGRTKITPIRVRSLGDAASAPISWWRPAPTTPARTDESVPARPNHWRATRTQMRVHRSCRA